MESFRHGLFPAGQAGVHDDQARDPLRDFGSNSQPDQTAPVLYYQRNPVQVQAFDKSLQRRLMHLEGIIFLIAVFIRPAEADEVHRDDAMPLDKGWDHLAV